MLLCYAMKGLFFCFYPFDFHRLRKSALKPVLIFEMIEQTLL